MQVLIGTDIGTSGTKSIVMDTKGQLLGADLQEYDIITPRPLWAEQWPEVWVDAVKNSIRQAVKNAGVKPEQVKGICISGLYGGSGIPLDHQMKPVRPCLIWLDRRASEQQKWVEKEIGLKRLHEITHNGADPYYGFTKILWMKENEPLNWEKTKLFLPPNAYAIYQLTGEVAIDYSSAGNIGGIFDMEKRCWSLEMMEKMEIPLTIMPQRLVESSEIVGFLTQDAAEELGLEKGTPVSAGGVDCVVATLGLGIFEPGRYAAAIGTSMCAALVHDSPIEADGLIEMPYVKDAQRLAYSFGGTATAGALAKWFRDQFAHLEKQVEEQGGKNAYQVLDEEASHIPPGSEGLVILPYFMGERSPVWDTNARGTMVGLSLSHTRAHIWRALMEAVAYSLRHTIEGVSSDISDCVLVAGGITKSKLWRQIIADVIGMDIVCPLNDVEANLGDVILAGIGTGLLTWEEAGQWQVLDNREKPDLAAHETYSEYYKVYRSIYENLREDMSRLVNISSPSPK